MGRKLGGKAQVNEEFVYTQKVACHILKELSPSEEITCHGFKTALADSR